MLENQNVALIGAGVMAEVIAQGLIRSRLISPEQIVMSHYREERLHELRDQLGGVRTTTDNRDAFESSDVAVLCVRPQGMSDLLRELLDLVVSERLLMSIAAGLPLAYYQSRVGESVPLIRAMPTFFGQIKAGTTGLSLSRAATAEHLALASRIFGTISESVIVLPDSEMDAFTTFGSTATATVYMLLDALITAGSLVGLRHQASHSRAIEQVVAAARNVEATGRPPGRLLEEICTPGGVTVEGVKVLEERAVRAAAIDGVLAAMQRARDLGRSAEES
jgi:pyrroline-5-carboxylate reductase